MTEATRRKHLAKNGATPAEIEILLRERVELNAMTSGALVEMIERKLTAYGLKKVIPNNDVLAEAYQEFHRSNQLRERFEEIENEFDETEIKIPKNLSERVRAILAKHSHLRWDDAIKIVLDKTQLDRVVEEKEKAKKKSGDFTDTVDDDEPS